MQRHRKFTLSSTKNLGMHQLAQPYHSINTIWGLALFKRQDLPLSLSAPYSPWRGQPILPGMVEADRVAGGIVHACLTP